MPTFLTYEKPLLTAMIQCPTPGECIEKIKASIAQGADALGVQLCNLKKEYRTKEVLTEIFDSCAGKPIYVTSYRYKENEGLTDEACAELLLLALDSGATLCDVMGDMFGRSPQYELTTDENAIKKQMDLIGEIHRRGGEVLMSSHTFKSTTLEENLMIAQAQAARGADIIKIVNSAAHKDEVPKYIQAIQQIKKETGKELLFLVSEEGQIIRYIGPDFGVCMYLCVSEYGPADTPFQPLLKDLKPIRDHMRFDI